METRFLYLDESGDAGWPEGYGGNSRERYFILAGVILTPEQNHRAKTLVNEVIDSYFADKDVRPDEIRYSDAVHGNKEYGNLSEEELNSFRSDLFEVLDELNPTLMGTIVDKQLMRENYGEDAHPPKQYAFRNTVGRFHKELESDGAIGSITIDFAERSFDQMLQTLIHEIKQEGMDMSGDGGSTLPRLLDTVLMSPSEMSPGIQLADIVAYQVRNEYHYDDQSTGFQRIRHLFSNPDGIDFSEPSVVPK